MLKNITLSSLTALVFGTGSLAGWAADLTKAATPAESIKVLDGFKVELLRSARPGEGSWVSMTVDNKGRLIVSPQGNEPMLRFTLDGQGQIASIETNAIPQVKAAMGLLYAFNSLYVNGQGPGGYHLYRLRDTDGNGQFAEPELIRKWNGGPGEHGTHGIVLGPDNLLYIVNGNFVDVPGDILPTSKHKNYADDLVIPRMEDGNGFGAGRKPPGGYVVRVDKDGKNAELFASGQRNTYDIAFNADGELFGFDSDMEWDWGAPWYRATRAYHIVSGGDQGFREGSAKYPTYYADSLPEVVDIGIGSPTGVLVPTKAKFPAKYRNALWMMDWSYGRIVAVHLQPNGSSYRGTFDTVIKGKPLNVTDMEVGPDGSLYFATGGRGTQSGLYRVSYVGGNSTEPSAPIASEARKLRHQLESFHGRVDARAVDTLWPHLSSSDRFLRYAARIALESQPVEEWKQRALDETEPTASITALLALARYGSKDLQEGIFTTLGRLADKELDEAQTLEALRVIEVSIARQGVPGEQLATAVVEKLNSVFPARSQSANRELAQILIALDAPGVVGKTLELINAAGTQEEQLLYVAALRKAKTWTLDERKRYLSWFINRDAGKDAGATYPNGGNYFINTTAKHPAQFEKWFEDVGLKAGNGASYNNFIKKLKAEIINGLADSERPQLTQVLTLLTTPGPDWKPKKEHQFVKDWKMADFADLPSGAWQGRSYANAREAFAAGQCIQCHRIDNEGGAIGPDLTGAGAKYSRRDLLQSMLEPSAVVSDQYANTTLSLKNGEDVTGRIVEDTATKLVLLINPLTGDTTEVKKADIKAQALSKTSPMPEGLLSILTREEILDLLAFMEAGGNQRHAVFRKK